MRRQTLVEVNGGDKRLFSTLIADQGGNIPLESWTQFLRLRNNSPEVKKMEAAHMWLKSLLFTIRNAWPEPREPQYVSIIVSLMEKAPDDLT
jgi:hypothetical protein